MHYSINIEHLIFLKFLNFMMLLKIFIQNNFIISEIVLIIFLNFFFDISMFRWISMTMIILTIVNKIQMILIQVIFTLCPVNVYVLVILYYCLHWKQTGIISSYSKICHVIFVRMKNMKSVNIEIVMTLFQYHWCLQRGLSKGKWVDVSFLYKKKHGDVVQ